jgi:cytochrome c peroxidase
MSLLLLTWQRAWLVGLVGLLAACQTTDPAPADEPRRPYPLNVPRHFSGNFALPADNPLTEQGVVLGRRLFFDRRLSGDNTVACANCHQPAAAFTDPGQARSRGVRGQLGTRNAMSLANLLWVSQFFWDGRRPSLEAQALEPLLDPTEMDQDTAQLAAELQATAEYPPLFRAAFGSERITAARAALALAQFQRTLISANSRYDRYLLGDRAALSSLEVEGLNLFFTHPDPARGLRGANCGDCHRQVMTDGDPSGLRGFHNNGLDPDPRLQPGLQTVTSSEFDRGKFRAPTLRNIALTAPYMHDGRLATLQAVLDHYDQHVQPSRTLDPLILEASNEPRPDPAAPVRLHLTAREKQAVLAFLRSLTDSSFITDPRFSSPFR